MQGPAFLSADDPDELPPSGRVYAAPAPPRRPRALWVVGGLALVAVIATGIMLLRPQGQTSTAVRDGVARVEYGGANGWRPGESPPPAPFTSSILGPGRHEARVYAGPGEQLLSGTVAAEDQLGAATRDLVERYGRYFVPGDVRPETVDARPLTVGGRPGYTAAVRVVFADVINLPAFLRATVVLRADGRTVVLLGYAQPDDDRWRREIDAVMSSARLT